MGFPDYKYSRTLIIRIVQLSGLACLVPVFFFFFEPLSVPWLSAVIVKPLATEELIMAQFVSNLEKKTTQEGSDPQ